MSAFFRELGRRRSRKETLKMSPVQPICPTGEAIPSRPDALFLLSTDVIILQLSCKKKKTGFQGMGAILSS